MILILFIVSITNLGLAQTAEVSDPRLELNNSILHISYDIISLDSLAKFEVWLDNFTEKKLHYYWFGKFYYKAFKIMRFF